LSGSSHRKSLPWRRQDTSSEPNLDHIELATGTVADLDQRARAGEKGSPPDRGWACRG